MVEGELKTWRSNPQLHRLEVAFRFLERPDLKQLPVGRVVIDDKAYAMVDKVPSQAPEKVEFESHRKVHRCSLRGVRAGHHGIRTH